MLLVRICVLEEIQNLDWTDNAFSTEKRSIKRMNFSDPVYMSIGYETFSYLICSVKSNFIIKYYNKWIKNNND